LEPFGVTTDILAQWPEIVQEMTPLQPDGSQRRFFRLRGRAGGSVLLVLPPADDPAGLAEARSAWRIGRHLSGKGVAVARPLAFDEKSGALLVEDLGDRRLQDHVASADHEERLQWYGRVVRELVRMQVLGREGFSDHWCWQGARYDRDLMLAKESGYFLDALCRDFLGIRVDRNEVWPECERLATLASRAPACYFLHRDFQSRNLMVCDGRIRIIDHQAGRLGPLAYDLASLLIDPYTGLGEELQEQIYDEYLRCLCRETSYDRQAFAREYLLLALQRNLQILGAFAFLCQRQGKAFFAPYILPALRSLRSLLAKTGPDGYPHLVDLVNRCLEHPVLERTDLSSGCNVSYSHSAFP